MEQLEAASRLLLFQPFDGKKILKRKEKKETLKCSTKSWVANVLYIKEDLLFPKTTIQIQYTP